MDSKIKSPFYFNGYYVNDVTFKKNENYNHENIQIKFDVDAKYDYFFKDNKMRGSITLYVDVFKDAKKNGYPFELKMTFVGKFSAAENDLKEQHFRDMMKVNGVAILFPYIRSAITDITKAANVTPLLLPSMNIINLLKKNTKQESSDISEKILPKDKASVQETSFDRKLTLRE